jgi:4a-hydroxytetrahydrobiopterin dehydratase
MITRMGLLSQEEAQRRAEELDGWALKDGAISKEEKRDDFAGSIDLVNRIAAVAEELNHHPDLEVSWDTVTITITTHSEGGLTPSDFELAERLDALA